MPTFTLNGKPVKNLPGVGKPVQLDPEIRGKLMGYLEANKDNPEYLKFLQGDGVANSRNTTPEQIAEEKAEQSAARRRLEKLKAQRGPVVVPFEYEGEAFHLKQLSYQQFLDLGQSVNRNSAGVLNLTPQSQAREVIIATLMACVCNEDGTPYFEYEDVEAYIEEAATAPLVAALYVACNAENESILSTLKKS